jgi:hypothetical protein
MEIIYLFFLLGILIYIFYRETSKENFTDQLETEINNIIRRDDINLLKIYQKIKFSDLLNNNKNTNINNSVIPEETEKIQKYKIAFLTYEDRNEDYITMHNSNMKLYCDKWGYEYIHISENNDKISPYWYKIFLVKKLLEKDYDYVFWLDSDSAIMNFNIDLGEDILNNYDSDIFVGSDNIKYDIVNAGLFIIRNSEIGKEFIDDWVKEYKPYCEKGNGGLRGRWAMSCYEQGHLNKLIYEKYSKYTSFLDRSIFQNNNSCHEDVFVMHHYGGDKKKRADCFRKTKH